jgi:PhnB protein
MSATQEPPRPGPMHVLSPHLVCAGAAAAIDFYKAAFGAEPLFRLDGPDGKIMHASLLLNGSSVMLTDERLDCGASSPKTLGGTPVTLHLFVPDVDAAIARAAAAGATVVMPAADMFWGDRYGLIEDPFGHRWSIATHQRDMSHDEIAAEMQRFISQPR